jgi:hypothetical protein
MENVKKVSGLNFLLLALCAFATLAIELLIGYVVLPHIFGMTTDNWETVPMMIHWSLTCIIWGVIAFIRIRVARKKFQFDLFEKGAKMKLWQWIAVLIGVVLIVVVSYKHWNGIKIVKEFQSNGWLLFIFQYIYYVVETVLFTLIIVFGQKAFEIWFKKENFPYGGVLVALTWGLGHAITKGSLFMGLYGAFSGFVFGAAYLLANRDIKKTYIILFIMFIL